LAAKRESRVNETKVTKHRVLVVDDEPMVCDSVEMMLAFDGHSVRKANSGPEALACLEQDVFDLVFVDYAMPQMRGDELARRIKQRHPTLPIVMITAHAELLESVGVPLPGVEMVISKPFLLDALRRAVAKCCGAAASGSLGR